MSSSWWAEKLGTQQPQQRVGQVQTPAPAPQQPQPQAMPQVPQQYAPQGQVQQVPNGGPDENGQVHIGQMLQQEYTEIPAKAQSWKEDTNCPECGGGNYFSRTQGVTRGPAPAPSCWDCGYPLVQSGSGTGSLSIASPTGTGQSRQPSLNWAPPMNTVIGKA